MLYVQQSLGPDEELLTGARFHWMYTVRAVFWIMFGLALGIAIGSGGIWWVVSSEIRETYGDLPSELYDRAWHQVVVQHGGYLHILWTLPALLRFGILGFFLLGLFFFAHLMIVKATTEIAVTSERIVYKKGLIARHVGELGIDRIEGVSVSQGVWGRLWDYGTIIIRGMGVGEVILPALIENPISFRKAIQEAKSMRDHGKSGAQKARTEDF
ncbi:MAG: PH domain-containing protein [Alphaproteobacteria bacterium]|nr:PH domain-containing protein [Alphaproteobacteria bacterium]